MRERGAAASALVGVSGSRTEVGVPSASATAATTTPLAFAPRIPATSFGVARRASARIAASASAVIESLAETSITERGDCCERSSAKARAPPFASLKGASQTVKLMSILALVGTASPGVPVVASGLANPRCLEFAPNGRALRRRRQGRPLVRGRGRRADLYGLSAGVFKIQGTTTTPVVRNLLSLGAADRRRNAAAPHDGRCPHLAAWRILITAVVRFTTKSLLCATAHDSSTSSSRDKRSVSFRAPETPASDDVRASEWPARTRPLRQGETKAQARARVTPVCRPSVVRSESLGRRGQDARISAESGSGAHRAPDAAALSAGLRLPKEPP